MSGLAEMLRADGFDVSGSDTADGYAMERLRALGVDARVGHQPGMVAGAGLLAYSAAISPDDPERLEARRLGIPSLERAELLGEMMRGYPQSVCVCGTHGKTTTTAMLAQAYTEMGLDPSVHLGGTLDAIGGGVRQGNGGIFIAEACEFNRSFLHMPVTVALVLNIEEDHLDCYGDMEHVEEAYLQFLELLPDEGIAVVNGGDRRVRNVVSRLEGKNRRVLTFGDGGAFDYTFSGLRMDAMKNPVFTALFRGEPIAGVRL
ncbi:MAG TPA: Mur ligase family protein, partial [Candidatus Limnocylindria bacterium]|nr:Mur ligase family protein [Candidatus Limnocylindria bacterium]